MPPRILLCCWLTTLACGARPAPVPGLEIDLEGRDPEFVQALEAACARVRDAPRDFQARFELAALLDANELDAAAEVAWSQVVALAPEDPGSWYHLAHVRERGGATEAALEAVAQALELAPQYAPAHLRLGRLLLESGRLEEAEPPLRRALELDPGAPGTRLALARLELLRDQPARAIELLEALRRRLPHEPFVNGLLARAYGMLGDPVRAETHLRAEEHAGASSARDPWLADVQRRALGMKVRLERARARLASGDAAGAWQELAPLEDRTSEPVVLGVQCQILLALGRPDEVLGRLERADARWADRSLLAVNRALALRAIGEGERALAEITAEVRRHPTTASNHALRGEILFGLERHSEAIQAYQEARAHGDASLSCLLQLARARTAAADFEGGLGDLEEAARLFPFAPKPWAYRSEVLALEGRVAEARASLEEAKKRGLEPELVAVVEARLSELEAESSAESGLVESATRTRGEAPR